MRKVEESSLIKVAVPSVLMIAGCVANKPQSTDVAKLPARLMSPQDLRALPSRQADFRITYGTDSSQFGELPLWTRKHLSMPRPHCA